MRLVPSSHLHEQSAKTLLSKQWGALGCCWATQADSNESGSRTCHVAPTTFTSACVSRPKYANARNLSPEKGHGRRGDKSFIGPTWAGHSNGNVQVFLCADECFKPFLEHFREQSTDQLRIHFDSAAPSSRASRKIPSTKSTTKCRSCTFRECQRVDLDMNTHAYIYIYVCACVFP